MIFGHSYDVKIVHKRIYATHTHYCVTAQHYVFNRCYGLPTKPSDADNSVVPRRISKLMNFIQQISALLHSSSSIVYGLLPLTMHSMCIHVRVRRVVVFVLHQTVW